MCPFQAILQGKKIWLQIGGYPNISKKMGNFPQGGECKFWKLFPLFLFIFKHGLNHPEMKRYFFLDRGPQYWGTYPQILGWVPYIRGTRWGAPNFRGTYPQIWGWVPYFRGTYPPILGRPTKKKEKGYKKKNFAQKCFLGMPSKKCNKCYIGGAVLPVKMLHYIKLCLKSISKHFKSF